MIFDRLTQFASAQVVTATAQGTNAYDMGVGRNIGAGKDKLFLVVQVAAAMTDAGTYSTVTPSLITSATATPSGTGVNAIAPLTNTINTILTLPAIPAHSAAGYQMYYPLPPSANYLRYIGVDFTVANGNLTTGSFNAFLATDVPDNYCYPEGFSPN